jgi:hypothetical protein
MELCFLSYFIAYFNKLTFYGVAKSEADKNSIDSFLKTVEGLVEGSIREFIKLRVGGMLRSTALKMLLDVTFDCLQAAEDSLLQSPNLNEAGYYFVKNEGSARTSRDWSTENERYNDAFYAIYKQFDEIKEKDAGFYGMLTTVSGVIFSKLSSSLVDIYFRPRFKTIEPAVQITPAPGKYPSFIYAPLGATLNVDTYHIVDMDNGGKVDTRSDLPDIWRGIISPKISGKTLPYAGLFVYFLVLAREYLKEKTSELGRLGCPLPTVLREGGLVSIVPGGRTAAAPAPAPTPLTSPANTSDRLNIGKISDNLDIFFKILGQLKRGIGSMTKSNLQQNIDFYTNSSTANTAAGGPLQRMITAYQSHSSKFNSLTMINIDIFRKYTKAEKGKLIQSYISQLYSSFKGDSSGQGENIFYKLIFDLFRAYVRQFKIKGATTRDEKIDVLYEDYEKYVLSAPINRVGKQGTRGQTAGVTLGKYFEITKEELRTFTNGNGKTYPQPPTNPFPRTLNG